MSAQICGQVWGLDLPHAEMLVLQALADHADHEGNNIYPSLGLIAWKAGYTDRQVRRIVHTLENKGILIAVEVRDGMATKYRLDLSKAPKKSAYSSSRTYPSKQTNPCKNVTPVKMSPLTSATVTPDICDTEPLTFTTPTPDIYDTRVYRVPVSEPSVEPSVEPSLNIQERADVRDVPAPVETSSAKTRKNQSDDELKALLAAYRRIRFPGKPEYLQSEFRGFRNALEDLLADGRTVADVEAATAAALARYQSHDMVNPRSISRNISALLESDSHTITAKSPQTNRDKRLALQNAPSKYGYLMEQSPPPTEPRALPQGGPK